MIKLLPILLLALCGCRFALVNVTPEKLAPAVHTTFGRAVPTEHPMMQSAVPPAPTFTVSRDGMDAAVVHVPATHSIQQIGGPALSLEELVDRYRTNRASLTILIAVPATNTFKLIPVPSIPVPRR